MSYEELKEKYELLEKENQTLKEKLRDKKDKTIWDRIQNIKSEWVDENYILQGKHSKTNIMRKITDDIKWDLHIRDIKDFKEQDIERVKEYLKTYKSDSYYEDYRKEVIV